VAGARLLTTHDLGARTGQVPDPDEAADARTHPHGYVDRIELGDGVEQLPRVGRHPQDQVRVEGRDDVEPALSRHHHAVLPGCLEVVAVLDELDSEAPHGLVLVRAVAVRDDDGHGYAVGPAGKREALPVVTARRRDDARHRGTAGAQPVEVDEATSHLEGPGRRVVLVLDPDLRADGLPQQRLGVLRCRPDPATDQGGCAGQVLEGERHPASVAARSSDPAVEPHPGQPVAVGDRHRSQHRVEVGEVEQYQRGVDADGRRGDGASRRTGPAQGPSGE